ncbi:hypothetical protein F2P79_024714 [Pimephales promelas]|nr:hypothetical protein F2P79_024714 [Pimephales promelas]
MRPFHHEDQWGTTLSASDRYIHPQHAPVPKLYPPLNARVDPRSSAPFSLTRLDKITDSDMTWCNAPLASQSYWWSGGCECYLIFQRGVWSWTKELRDNNRKRPEERLGWADHFCHWSGLIVQ